MPYQKGEGKSVVIALGGNALGNTPQEQLQLVKDTAKHIVDTVSYTHLLIHGCRKGKVTISASVSGFK